METQFLSALPGAVGFHVSSSFCACLEEGEPPPNPPVVHVCPGTLGMKRDAGQARVTRRYQEVKQN